ncbi:MAG: indole-3-glycerol phosphate synthase TrpC [Gemmatimonadota bacterium]|nr:MAG: indole-3-glycerol phosphate synthase TrpC [Gemmatimonadota bacterium]
MSAEPGILDMIAATKRKEVEALRPRAVDLEAAALNADPPRDFAAALKRPGLVSVIAEVKRKSPGAGPIRPDLEPARLASSYHEGGASALSILTDRDYFGGSLDDLRAARAAVDLPILRKDFMIDPLQVLEARAAGSDAVLLIVRILDDARLAELLSVAESLGMAALVEVHDGTELRRAVQSGARVVGINNRDLSTFATRIDVTLDLLPEVPAEVLVVSESGIRSGDDVARLGSVGVDAVLVGEWLLGHKNPTEGVRRLAGHAVQARARRG